MTLTIREFNEMPLARAEELLRSVCGATRWVSAMVARRPFASRDDVCTQADDTWRSLGEDDWREAFAHHPRIGQRKSEAAQTERASDWSAGEQASVTAAPGSLQDELVAVNREYETRFGHIYIVCAAGKTASALLALARERLYNAPGAELRVAAEEQRQITRLRLQKLFTEHS